MVNRDLILDLVRKKGPILPNQIRMETGGDTITIGAILSELAASGQVKISSIKVGGSPVYYISEQRGKLQELKSNLNDKQERALDMLKEAIVLRDSEQEPVIRTSLRAIKDFAKALEVKTSEGSEIFWKWYLATNEEAELKIRQLLKIQEPEKEENPPEAEEQTAEASAPVTKAKEKAEPEAEKQSHKPPAPAGDTQKSLPHELGETDDKFTLSVRDYFKENKIIILEENIVRKGFELEYVILVPNAFGKQEYFCKVKSKKKCNDGDLSSAYVKGQFRRLPVVFLTNGELTKKAEEMLNQEFKGMLLSKL